MIEMVLKLLFFAAKLQKPPSGWGLCPQALSVIRLSCISLLSLEPKLDDICAKKFTFGSSPLSLSKILFALLVAFTPGDKIIQAIIRAAYKTS